MLAIAGACLLGAAAAAEGEAAPRSANRPRGTAGKEAIQCFDYGDRWVDWKVYLVKHQEGFRPDAARIPETLYGGRSDQKSKATGFFRVEKIDGRWWFVDPEGGSFHATGINYGRSAGAVDRDFHLLRKNGFNALHVSIEELQEQWPDRSIGFPYFSNLMLTFTYLTIRHSGDNRMWDAPPLCGAFDGESPK